MKLTKQARKCLQEALRRLVTYGSQVYEPLFPGYPSELKSIVAAGVMTSMNNNRLPERGRVMWYKFTEKGGRVAEEIIRINTERRIFTKEDLYQAFIDPEEWVKVDKILIGILKEIDYEDKKV